MNRTLDLDVGNTRCKWRLSGRESTSRGACAIDEIDGLPAGLEAYPESVRVSCVRGQAVENHLTDWARRHFGIQPEFARTRSPFKGLTIAYKDPSRLGVDRWLAMLAARQLAPGETACVVDCGSAITLDLVDSTGLHRGGYIVPGLEMMRQALLRNTDKVRFDLSSDLPETAPGESTGAAVRNGTLTAALGCIERAVTQMDRIVSVKRWFLTGGDGPLLQPLLGIPFDFHADLVLEGLAISQDLTD